MPTTDFFGIIEIVAGDTTGLVTKMGDALETLDAACEGVLRAITNNSLNGIIVQPTVGVGTDLTASIGIGSFIASGIYCANDVTTTLVLPAEVTAHIYGVAAVSPNPSKTCTFQASASATPPERGIEIATAITTTNDITSVDNASAGRPKWAWEA